MSSEDCPYAMNSEPPWDELDPLVVPLVRVLHDAGIPTSSSCQGGDGHMMDFPTVISRVGHPTSLQGLRFRCLEALLAAGWHGFTLEEVRLYQNKRKPMLDECLVRVVVWNLENQPKAESA